MYEEWCWDNLYMQNMCYYSTLVEFEKGCMEGKTFLEVESDRTASCSTNNTM